MKYKSLIKAMFYIGLVPALMVGQNVFSISEGENKIDSLLYNVVQAGDTIELKTNGGYYYEYFAVEITVPLTIRAKEGLEVKPIWICDDAEQMITFYDDLTLQGIRFDGVWGINPTQRCIKTDSTGTGTGTKLDYKLKIDNCDFVNFGDRAIYAHPYTQADTVAINNSLFAHIGERAIYYKDPVISPGSAKHFFLENSTFWDIGEDVIYVEDHDNDTATPGPEFVVDHVTVHDPGMVDAAIKSIYPKNIDGALIKNSMVTRTELNTATTPARIYGTNSAVLYFLDWNTDDVSLKDDATIDDTTGTNYLENIDPLQADNSIGDLRIFDDSPAVGFGEEGTTLGDPRWDGYNGITVDGFLSDWPEWTRLDTGAANDPALHDTTELKAFWFSYDSTKIALRADFFGPCDWRGGSTSGTWNYNSGAIRIYFYDPIGNKWRIRLYQNSINSSYTRAKLLLDSGPDFPGIDSGRNSGLAQWSDDGTSVEIFFPGDSLTTFISQWSPDSTVKARMWVLNGWGGQTSRLPPEGSYYWFKLGDVNPLNPPLSVDDDGISANIPTNYKLSQNYPNPFNPATTIEYSIPVNDVVTVKVYTILGQTITTLVEQEQSAGKYSLNWDATDDWGKKVASGIYFYQLTVGNKQQGYQNVTTKKMILLR